MAEVSAFRGIHYEPAVVQLETVLAPPYDVIGPQLQLELYGRAMQNVVRIELGRDFDDDVQGERDRYTRARDHLDAWLEQGVLVQDAQPSVYVHRHSFRPPGGGGPRERLGCFVGVEPVPHERREVLRHELTMTAPRADRLRLLQATKVQTSPVFLLYEDQVEVTRVLEQVISMERPFAEAVVEGEYGSERHQLWQVADPETVGRITAGLSQTRLFIADGHHRYETALNLGLRQVLALVSPLDDAGNVILPIHRVVPQASAGLDRLAETLARRGWQTAAVAELSAALAQVDSRREEAHTFAMVGSAGNWVVSRPRQEEVGSPRLGLDVTVLESEIIEPLLGVGTGGAAAGRLLYTRDPQEAVELALAQDGVAFLVNPTTVAEVAAVALAGEAMPQKSTYFFPKVPAGLVILGIE
ncbi:MAG TPA: DUF1015 domain-containing protein [Candidatus Dormibacteraeota bacterium]|nr:DUF1015 domain-containing protein [Candidatus Dormibacteraeota bacterium]